MQFKLLNLNNPKKNYQFDLSAIDNNAWKRFIYDVVLSTSNSIENVDEICASITIRENQAKTMIGYQDNKYNQLNFTLSPLKSYVGENNNELIELWQSMLASVYGEEYLDTVQNQNTLTKD